jgi:galactokinase
MSLSFDHPTSPPTGLIQVPHDERTQQLYQQAAALLGRTPQHAWWVPGRVEVLGKHTDYAGGRVLNCATDVGLVVVAHPRNDLVIQVTSNEHVISIPLQPDARGEAGFSTYLAAVARRLSRHFPGLTVGCDIAVTSNLPAASGMSSSSAFVIALHLAIAAVNHLEERADYQAGITSLQDLIPYLGGHENGAGFATFAGDAGVGTAGGSQDHAAVMASIAGHLNHWSFAPFQRIEAVSWPSALHLSVAVSGVLAEKSAGARDDFNLVANRAKAALAAWNQASGRADTSLGFAFQHAGCDTVLQHIHDPDLRLRAEQTAIESTLIVPGACAALTAGDLSAFGSLTARSQGMATTHLRNQIAETLALVEIAKAHGAVAASAFGAGFGGSVWAAFPAGDDQEVTWLRDYHQQFPQHRSTAQVHRIHPGPGVTRLDVG